MKNTLIQIDEEVWEYIKVKKKIGESFNDVLRRELKIKPIEKTAKINIINKTKKELNPSSNKRG